jgi:hypothetical protein
VRGRRPEDGDDGIADELLDGAAVALELVAEPRVVRREQGPDVLGVEALGALGRADHVGEDDRHALALLARRGSGRGQWCSALGGELRRLRVLRATGGAGAHRTILRACAAQGERASGRTGDVRKSAARDTVRGGAGLVPLHIERG